MNRPHRLLQSAALALAALAGAAGAQDFDGQVQSDPRAGLAIYDFHFQGPPRGFAVMFLSPWIARNPLQLPQIGNLHLDLGLFLQVGTIPMNSQGQGRFRLQLPLQLAQSGLAYQPLFIDTRLNMRLIYTLGFDVRATSLGTFLAKWSSKTGKYTLEVPNVKKGDSITVNVDNRRMHAGQAKQDGVYKACFRHPGVFHRGSRIEVLRNNKPLTRVFR